jgi:hypothetical protein
MTKNFKLPSGHDATVTLLKNATAQGFRLGETPLSRFLQSRPGVEEGLSDVDFQTASEQLKMMQRVYQITPSNEAMPVLIKLDITSAYDVMAHPEEQFASLFRTKYLENQQYTCTGGTARADHSQVEAGEQCDAQPVHHCQEAR